ncbi:Major Facilitator Superfamily protein [compost metagenome]
MLPPENATGNFTKIVQRVPVRVRLEGSDAAWVQTAYLIAEIIVIPLSGWLSRVMSTRWLFAASAAGFTLTSLLCAMAWNV